MSFKKFPGIVAVLSFFLVSCDERDGIQFWANRMDALRMECLKNIGVRPYRTTEHESFKAYFSEILKTQEKLENDSEFLNQLNEGFLRVDVRDFCLKSFISKSTWQKLILNCEKNGFFLCSEDIRSYPESLEAFRNKLEPQQRMIFDQTKECQVIYE